MELNMNISSENVEGEIGVRVWVFPTRSLICYSKTTFVVNSIACMHRASLSSYVYREITDVYACENATGNIVELLHLFVCKRSHYRKFSRRKSSTRQHTPDFYQNFCQNHIDKSFNLHIK